MSATTLALLSLPVLVLWFAPGIAFLVCTSFGPCARTLARLRRAIWTEPLRP